ncbi:MAG: glycosyltransferase [Patescibacteria group bacterium]
MKDIIPNSLQFAKKKPLSSTISSGWKKWLNAVVEYWKSHHINAWAIFYFIVYIILVLKFVTIRELDDGILFGAYSILVSLYILSRFALAYLYDPVPTGNSEGYEPTVTFAVPSKNEGANIRETIMKIAESDYPKHKFDIVAVNDGSTDATLAEMLEAKKLAKRIGVEVEVVHWEENRGKREGMAECTLRSKNELVVFIDSDSFVVEDTLRELVKYFIDPRVGAVAGHGFVANADTNALTKMQDVRYFVAFKAYKAAESLFGTVTCCSGCGSAYRRTYMMKVLDEWRYQKFLGQQCTYGDDRSLTNFLLRDGYITLYAPKAKIYTIVPDTFRQFMRQQLRWKKSWTKETLKAGLFIWKRNPIMSISFYLGAILPLVSPIVALRALIWQPFLTGNAPWFYIIGLFLMALCYGIYYYVYTRDKYWIYGVCFAIIYTLALMWQLPWAMMTLKDPRWGTR